MQKVINGVVSGIGRVNWLLGAASAVIGFAVVGVVVQGVVMRYVFKSPTAYSIELPEVLFVALIALCLAYTQMHGRHVRVELITSRLHGRLHDGFGILASVITLGYCVIVAWALWQKTVFNLAKDIGTVQNHIPLAPFSIVIVVGMFVMALQVLIDTAGFLRKGQGK